jgi:integrase
VVDAKTPAGVREVHLSPWLREELNDYFASFAQPPRPKAPAFPTRTGGRRDKDNIRARVLHPVLARADEMRGEQGLPPIAVRVTPHTLRRTYATLLLTAGAEPQYVMAQLGHTDPTMTLRLYALVLKRHDRTEFGAAFDRLMTDALPEHTGIPSTSPTKISNTLESIHGSAALQERQEYRG